MKMHGHTNPKIAVYCLFQTWARKVIIS